jgi:hypothetical protein
MEEGEGEEDKFELDCFIAGSVALMLVNICLYSFLTSGEFDSFDITKSLDDIFFSFIMHAFSHVVNTYIADILRKSTMTIRTRPITNS